MKANETAPCCICHKTFPNRQLARLDSLRPVLLDFIRQTNSTLELAHYICRNDLNHYRAEYVQSALEHDKGELSQLEQQVIESIREQEILSRNLSVESKDQLSIGERLSDRMAEFGGSWVFLIIFAIIIGGWIGLNGSALLGAPFDPYPFILLNLVLSCLAAIQAPIIMMSQNRQEMKDRERSEHDYQVNLKAELEIRHLHEKLDYLLMQQWHRLLEIQQIQVDLLQEIATKSRKVEQAT